MFTKQSRSSAGDVGRSEQAIPGDPGVTIPGDPGLTTGATLRGWSDPAEAGLALNHQKT